MCKELQEIQYRIFCQVCLQPVDEVRYVVGLDAAYDPLGKVVVGAGVVLKFPELSKVESKVVLQKVDFPYRPGYFAFREAPVLLRVLKQLETQYHLIMCDGHGLAHSQRCGLATYLGVLLQQPTIGVAKERLVGTYELKELRKGNFAYLKDEQQIIGAVICTRDRVKPVFASIGNRIVLPQVIEFVLQTSPKFRIPEPIRQAHRLANQALKIFLGKSVNSTTTKI